MYDTATAYDRTDTVAFRTSVIWRRFFGISQTVCSSAAVVGIAAGSESSQLFAQTRINTWAACPAAQLPAVFRARRALLALIYAKLQPEPRSAAAAAAAATAQRQ